MPEYIDREKSMHYLEDYYNKMNGMNPWYYTGFKNAVGLLEHVEKSDVAPVIHGKWELRHEGYGHYWECSVCNTNPCIYVTRNTKFCPNCGAKMDLGEE